MKLLLFSDLHCDREAARTLLERAAEVDVLVGAGDFANGRHGLEICMNILSETDRSLVLVAGNNESTEELRAECAGWDNTHILHGEQVRIGDLVFFGLGGGVPVTPFGPWSYDLTEEAAEALLAPMPPGCVFVTHSPPKGLADRNSAGRSLGSQAVRAAIEAKAPRLVVCGHIHASAGRRETLGPTQIINAGPAGVIWSTDT